MTNGCRNSVPRDSLFRLKNRILLSPICCAFTTVKVTVIKDFRVKVTNTPGLQAQNQNITKRSRPEGRTPNDKFTIQHRLT
ncbi:MAG: hypothetical protein ACOX6A_10100 [Atribacter sp.]|uniref:hypothetical protein n=1 Tax=Atribacter sp. TaxID=2847780 RepID=UPI003D952C13